MENCIVKNLALKNKRAPNQQSNEAGFASTKAGDHPRKSMTWDIKARGEPFLWGLGGALVLGILMIVGFVVLIIYNGFLTFFPKPIDRVSLRNGSVVAGELSRSEIYRPGPELLCKSE